MKNVKSYLDFDFLSLLPTYSHLEYHPMTNH